MDLLGFGLTGMHRARRVHELIADPARILEQLRLGSGQFNERVARSLTRKSRRHRRLGHFDRAAEGAFDQAACTLLVKVRRRTEPCLERLATVAAPQVEDDHKVIASGIGRRWLSAGMRERTSVIRARSISAKPPPSAPPMSSNPPPHGSTTSEWPNVWRPSS